MDQEKQNEQSSESREEQFIRDNRELLRYDGTGRADLFREALNRLESASQWEDNWRELFKSKCADIARLESENATLRENIVTLKCELGIAREALAIGREERKLP